MSLASIWGVGSLTAAVLRTAAGRRAAACLVALSSVVCAAAPVLAAGPVWRDSAQFSVRVFEHSFQRASANDVGCVVRMRIYFDAPASEYRDPAAARNHYRFLAEVRLSGGNKFLSEVFSNTEPGARVIEFSHDTALEGCWAKQELKLRKVNVHACRGATCVPQPFQ